MLKQEFEKLVGYEVTDSEYSAIEAAYMAAGDMDKVKFCEEWKQHDLGKSEVLGAIMKKYDAKSEIISRRMVMDEHMEKELLKRGLKWNTKTCMFEECKDYEVIRTLEDAMEATGMSLPDCYDSFQTDIKAYLRLRIICAAINGLTEATYMDFPNFAEGETRYYPWWWIYKSKEEAIDAGYGEEEIIAIPAVVGSANTGDNIGVSCLNSNSVASASYTTSGGALALRDRDRALYCGKQFKAEWVEFYTKREVVR